MNSIHSNLLYFISQQKDEQLENVNLRINLKVSKQPAKRVEYE